MTESQDLPIDLNQLFGQYEQEIGQLRGTIIRNRVAYETEAQELRRRIVELTELQERTATELLALKQVGMEPLVLVPDVEEQNESAPAAALKKRAGELSKASNSDG